MLLVFPIFLFLPIFPSSASSFIRSLIFQHLFRSFYFIFHSIFLSFYNQFLSYLLP
jgi:hypothetical protein